MKLACAILMLSPSHCAYGTKIAEAVAPVSWTASRTLAKTGFPRCVSPAFFGFVPPTTLVPNHYQCKIFPQAIYVLEELYRSQLLVVRGT